MVAGKQMVEFVHAPPISVAAPDLKADAFTRRFIDSCYEVTFVKRKFQKKLLSLDSATFVIV
jgi:hypothetical protein